MIEVEGVYGVWGIGGWRLGLRGLEWKSTNRLRGGACLDLDRDPPLNSEPESPKPRAPGGVCFLGLQGFMGEIPYFL